MWKEFASLLNLLGRISRERYLYWGVSLLILKFLIDLLVAQFFFGRRWSPLQYLIWPDDKTVRVFQLPADDRVFAIVMLSIAVPFIVLGISMTLQRLRDAGWEWALILLFFLPLVNLLFIAWLCMVPTDPSGTQTSVLASPPVVSMHRRLVGQRWGSAFGVACLTSLILTVSAGLLATSVLKSYGFGIFVLLPFANGWLAAVLFGMQHRRSWSECVTVALCSLLLSAIALVFFAIEGLICILMLAPLAVILGVIGATVGYAMQSRHWQADSTPAMMLALVVLIPTLMAAESHSAPKPELATVVSEIIINAPPEAVWKHVVGFSPLPPPTEWFFRMGIAYPKHAEIVGKGVGAVRYCVFSTGAFVEPITVWDEPRRLAFDVAEQPCPMFEFSPFNIHPPHLDNFLVSHRGEFRLEALPDGKTRLIGTTWYTNKMWPASYWELWSDYLIGSIHERVLRHVKQCAEEAVQLK